ncbi:hypothetical protein CRUP_002155, partial [Coryphaenoides rupestris]
AVHYVHEPYVEFPPARPTADLLYAICEYGSQRLRYPRGYFPRSGFSHLRRRGKALDRLESWYAGCCAAGLMAKTTTQATQTTLCCAEQAWKQALTMFCADEYATKTAAFFCCEERDEAMWTCFNSDPANPQYSPSEWYTAPVQPRERGFTFSRSEC